MKKMVTMGELITDTDMSAYSDRLWKLAYERGKNERFVRCKDCANWDTDWHSRQADHHYCWMVDLVTDGEFYCAYSERR